MVKRLLSRAVCSFGNTRHLQDQQLLIKESCSLAKNITLFLSSLCGVLIFSI